MISSTSNSELPRAGRTLICAALVVALVALWRTDGGFATAPSWYWRMKLEWHHTADIVLVGDSQVYRGLDPSVFAATWGGRALNFGFSGAGLDARYLDAVERVLDPASSPPVVVLAVSPWSLTPRAAGPNGFTAALEEQRRSSLPAVWLQRLDSVTHRLRPAPLEVLPAEHTATRAAAESYRQEFRPDGWVASEQSPPQITRGLESVRANHAHANRVDPAILAAVQDRIRRWTGRGWHVVVFVPPGAPEVDRLARDLAGFDARAVARAVVDAGARWVDVGPDAFETYDGIHLTRASAVRLSRHLATAAPPPRRP